MRRPRSLAFAAIVLIPALSSAQVLVSPVTTAPVAPGLSGLGAVPSVPRLSAPSMMSSGLSLPQGLSLPGAPSYQPQLKAVDEVPAVAPVELKPFETFDPTAIQYTLDDTILVEGFLNKSVTLMVRLAPKKRVEVQTKHFLKPAEEWRAATFDEVLGLRSALKRHTDGLAEGARDRNLYFVAYGALLAQEPSVEELRKVKDQLIGFLIHPFVPHAGLRVLGIGLTKGKVVVNVEGEAQIPLARRLVEKRFPAYAPYVTYKAVGKVSSQG